MNLDIHGEVL